MEIEKAEVFGFQAALRGMRNPMESWDRNDSKYYNREAWLKKEYTFEVNVPEMPVIGPNDMKLAKQLIRAGDEHCKFLRQIKIWVDFVLPRYVLTELDTYKVGTVRNSCSTMHKLGTRNLTNDDFQDQVVFEQVLCSLNEMAKSYREKLSYLWNKTGKVYNGNALLKLMKANLPEGYLQRITYTMNYKVALSMYLQRKKHRLREWNKEVCTWIRQLPYMVEFISSVE